jgi:hypothetical protein
MKLLSDDQPGIAYALDRLCRTAFRNVIVTPPTKDIVFEHDVAVTMRDGVKQSSISPKCSRTQRCCVFEVNDWAASTAVRGALLRRAPALAAHEVAEDRE